MDAALDDPRLVPPGPPPSLRPGATASLQEAMARFASGDLHRDRRRDVVAAIEALAPPRLRSLAAARAGTHLTVARVDAVAELGNRVPTEALADALGVGDHAKEVRADVRRVVEVIGRGAPSSPSSDAAATRLRRRFDGHPAGAVAVVSLLYQAHDATAALLAATIAARHRPDLRCAAVPRTLRLASADIDVAGAPVAAGTLVVLDLAAAGLGFGAGPHRCPGEAIADAIVAGVVDALAERGYELVPERVVVADGRLVRVPMERRC